LLLRCPDHIREEQAKFGSQVFFVKLDNVCHFYTLFNIRKRHQAVAVSAFAIERNRLNFFRLHKVTAKGWARQ
jgi:hypothetical protein